MIRHIVMWKVDSSVSNEDKNKHVNAFMEKLLQLEGKISELKSIGVYLNASNASDTNYDIMLDTTFNSIEDLKSYAIHPEHLKVVDFAKSVKKERACVDYEF